MDVNLVLFKKSGRSKSFALPSSVTVVGRRQDCDLCIPLQIVSKRHCEFNLDGGHLRLRDLDSRNGTFINGGRVVSQIDVNPGDKIKIGPLDFVAQIDGKPEDVSAVALADDKELAKTSLPEKQFVDHTENASEFDVPPEHNATEILEVLDDLDEGNLEEDMFDEDMLDEG
jgi:pSer/pThr/pTyr-binding forkhead associated (FHA) protein